MPWLAPTLDGSSMWAPPGGALDRMLRAQDWVEVAGPQGPTIPPPVPAPPALVRTVNGKTANSSGALALTAADVGALDQAAGDSRYQKPTAADARYQVTGNRTVFLGDSITLAADNPSQPSRAASWPVYASIMSRQRIYYVRNAGIGGNTSAQMLTRFDTDVTPYSPRVVTLCAGVNDIGTGVALAAFQANISAIVAKIRAINARPVLCTIPPNNATGTRKQSIIQWNAWLRAYAAAQGIAVLDFYSVLVDPATGNYLAAYDSGDGTHPNDAGHTALGSYVANKLAPLLPEWAPIVTQDANDPYNLTPNKGLFLAGTVNANGEPPGWLVANPTSVTASIVTGDTSIIGNWWKGTYSAAAAEASLYTPSIALTGVDGHQFLYTARAKSALTAGNLSSFEVGFTATASLTARPAFALSGQITDGLLCLLVTAPAGTTAVRLQHKVAAGSTGSIQLAQIGLYDLTAMGLTGL